MEEILILLISQIAFSYFRTINTKQNIEGKTKSYLVSSVIIKISVLISTYIGILSIIDGNYLLTIIYVLSGVLGDYLGIKFYKK